jgi:hypothetical protein
MKTKGHWIIKTSNGGYWCGNAHFDTQIRKAQIYHWKEAAEEQIETLRRRKYITDASTVLEVIEVVPPQEKNETVASWKLTFLPGEYSCTSCGGFALHKSDGTEVLSAFCPHCGKAMTSVIETLD